MLDEKMNPNIAPQVEPKKGNWVFKLILVGIVIAFIIYVWLHPELVRDPVNKAFGNLMS